MNQTAPADSTRRSLLMGAGALLAAAAAPAAAASTRMGAGMDTDRGQARPVNLAHGGLEDWQAMVGERFSLASGAALRLVSVTPHAEKARPSALKRRHGFTAVFESAGQTPEGNRTYWLGSQGVAPLPVFLGRPSEGPKPQLVAVFG
jgi:hypothetical protein